MTPRHFANCEIHTGYGNTVSECFVSGRIRCALYIRPSIGETLEPLTFERSQSADEVCARHILLCHQIFTAAAIIAALCAKGCTAGAVVSELALSENFSLIHKISGIFVLSGALGTDHIVVLEEVYTLSAKYGMMV